MISPLHGLSSGSEFILSDRRDNAYKEISWLGQDYREGIVSTVGALVGMIPEGLYLLTSLALLTSIVRLAQKKTLVHEMDCIETLARVDTLCVDKTGTVTENKMTVEDVVPLMPDRIDARAVEAIMADYVYAMQADNDTMIALKKYFTGQASHHAQRIYPFTSSKKFGARRILSRADICPRCARCDPRIALR